MSARDATVGEFGTDQDSAIRSLALQYMASSNVMTKCC